MTDLKKIETPRQLFERPEVQERFKKILGQKTPGFIVSVINCINESELLHAARRDGSMKWSGLYRYMKRVKEMRDERGV